LIEQLRERNFILCYRGLIHTDLYIVLSRVFCAVEIVQRFEQQRSLTFEHLRDEVFEPIAG
jgi:hypothetical protein